MVESINLPNDPLVGGQPTSVTVRLASPAGPDGCRLGIASSTTYAPLSATLTVPARASSITIPLSVASVGSPKLAQLRTLTSGNPYVFRKFTIVPALLGSIVVAPNPIKSGDTVVGTIKLKLAAPAGGYLVTISSSDPTLLSVPRTVLVPYGATSAAFPVSVSAPSTSTVVTITASIDSQTPVATDVTINP